MWRGGKGEKREKATLHSLLSFRESHLRLRLPLSLNHEFVPSGQGVAVGGWMRGRHAQKKKKKMKLSHPPTKEESIRRRRSESGRQQREEGASVPSTEGRKEGVRKRID